MNLFRSLTNRLSAGIAVDLGTANTLVHVRGKGILVREPSVVAVAHDNPSHILEVGEEARLMLGRTPANIVASRPLKDGVIADFDQTERMLRYFIHKAGRTRSLLSPQIAIGVPSGITEVEKLAVFEAAKKSGARSVYLIAEPIAAAIGAGLSVHSRTGVMIVDIGGGTSEVAVIASKGVVTMGSIRIAGDEIDDAITDYVRREYKLLIGAGTAEQTKLAIGSAWKLDKELAHDVRGRDLISGLPRQVKLTSQEVRKAIAEPVASIIELVATTLERTPPELSSDVLATGVVLAGGGALLRGLDTLLATTTHMPIRIAADPLSCVALGIGVFLDSLTSKNSLRSVAMDEAHFGFA